ncbi:MAG: hypothetical protein KDD47_25475, partial [Acidobacteria bacterium]|nr:hypothetical protein [Acidobacteriota bacterium]
WLSWGQVASAVAAGVQALSDLPPAAEVVWIPELNPPSLASLLAIAASGRHAVPLGCLGERDPQAVALPTGSETPAGLPAGLLRVCLPEVLRRPGLRPPADFVPPGGGGTLVPVAIEGSPFAEARFVSEMELAEQAAGAFRALAPARRRDVLLAPPPVEGGICRKVLSWSLLSGAALALEPVEAAWPSALHWIRPTILAGAPERIFLGRRALSPPRWRRSLWPWARCRTRLRAPLDRLRAVVVLGGGELKEEEAAFWRRLGVEVVCESDGVQDKVGALEP